jgi:pimeloyl-ACP methyl ester carboxylesterase
MPLPLAAHLRGHNGTFATPLVFVHGLTFDHRMWDPVLSALPPGRRALALDLPGHGASPARPAHDPESLADAIRETLEAAGIDRPVIVGHSAGALAATAYAAEYGAAAVVNVDMPLYQMPFARRIQALAPELQGDAFPQTWARFRESMHQERLPAGMRRLLRAGDAVDQELLLSYWAPLFESPLDAVTPWIDDLLARVGDTPYLTLYGSEPDAEERSYVKSRLPHAQVGVWPVGHHFPHLADPGRFAAALTGIAVS